MGTTTMTLRTKTLLLISLTLGSLVIILYVVLRAILLDGFATLESGLVLQHVNTTETLIDVQVRSLHRAIEDWSSWDDTYYFASGENDSYEDDNLYDEVFDTLHINMMMFLDTAGEIINADYFDSEPVPDTVVDSIYAAIYPHAMRGAEDGLQGIVTLPEGIFLLAGRPILQNDGSGPSHGTLIWARRMGSEAVAELTEQLGVEFDIQALNDPALADDFRAAFERLNAGSSVATLYGANAVYGYSVINDLDGEPALVVKTAMSRALFNQGQISLQYFVAALAVVGVAFTAATLLLLERLVLLPLTRISQGVRSVSDKDDFSFRLPAMSKDELGLLVDAINHLLHTVNRSRNELQALNAELEQRVEERTAELEQQRSQLQAIMDNMSDGVLATHDDQITYMNGGITRLLGYSSEELTGRPCTVLCDPKGATKPAMPAGETVQFETSMVRSDGAAITVVVTSTPLPSPGARLVIVRDVTQEKQLQLEREHFFARASHELRTPLANILTRLYLLEKKPDELPTHLTILNAIAGSMRDLVNDLLDLSRFQQGKIVIEPAETGIQALVAEVVEIQRPEADVKSIVLLTRMQSTPLFVNGDPKRLRQVITNLITNAIRYTPSGGQIVAEVFRADERNCSIRVRDNGVGISAEHLPRLFDPFYRVNSNEAGGTGLGLPIVKQLVELHGGTISVESMPGKGSIFCVTLPLLETSHSRMFLKEHSVSG